MAVFLQGKGFRVALSLIILLGIISAVILGRNMRRQVSASKSPSSYFQEGEQLPASLSFHTLNGETKTLNDFPGKVLLINFWAGWCAPCLREMPSLYALHRRLADRGLVVLAVSMDEDPAQGIAVLKKVAGEIPFPVYAGLQSKISESIEIQGLPHTLILDRNRNLKYSRPGEVDWNSGAAADLVEKLL